MSKQVVPLTDTKVKNIKPSDKQQRLSDGDGLYMIIKTTGSKLWRFDFTLNGKRNTISLGKYPDISLSKARELRKQYRERVAHGSYPIEKKVESHKYSVDDAADAFYDRLSSEVSEKYLSKMKRRYELYIKKHIGGMDIVEVEARHIVKMIDALGDKWETAKRVHGIAARIFSLAVTKGHAKRNCVNDIDISVLVGSIKQKHFAHITDEKSLGVLLNLIDRYEGDMSTVMALKILPYVFVRPSNVRFMEWNEIDFKKKLWKIPAEKMKMDRVHLVPLADQVIEMLLSMEVRDTGYVFYSPLSRMSPLSENTLSYGMKRLGYKDVQTPHGFRHTASTFLHENMSVIGVSSEVIEAQLAHEVKGVRGIYNHAKYITERVKLMQWWADHLDDLKRQYSHLLQTQST